MTEIFYDEIFCEDGENCCESVSTFRINECEKFQSQLNHYGWYCKCPDCIKESKEIYPELYI